MHLSTLSITDVRQFEKRTFDFSPGFNLLIGENGAGKTTIIRALLAALGGANQTGPYPKLDDEDIRLNREQADVEAAVFGLRRNAVTFHYSKRLWELGSRSHTRKERPLVLSYASNEATCSSMNVRSAKRIRGTRGFDSRRDEEFLFYGDERTPSTKRPDQSALIFGNCSGLMILDTNLGGKIHLTEVFNDNEKKNIQS
jgi:energy-coupling factor transporter ATP-binding protein EcfA2